ncbi:hypothetical protein AA0313_1492 [Acetobacter indonesiensis NRIC 0313]|uniref:Peptidase M20 n=1 Tax=Acetobacter indonesiensis TaxID=104101 RepID=A0A6N3T5B5_9PROT|nr:M20/M25/M40 family metallo-hydrolase [Acetobacter indonesiensis]GAN63053.1 hypothetical protein Abin_016_061 [Acetobacter indonesiensis]GBQ57533.1 hypothetical protein AA0313_1492 [Acetobacter indonesiensis NRIC 0313]GEN04466.1 peptidase M20 [Acetobacter indonesiensis]
MRNVLIALALLPVSAALPLAAHAEIVQHSQAETQALDLAKKAISLRSVAGPSNKTKDVAQLFKETLVDGGFSEKDITITPLDDTVYMTATWPGTDTALKPLVILGHMDVVEAKPSDWTRDPFTPVVENGYLFGRGATDMKLDDALIIASVLELKRQGYKPRRSIILAFSGDEETAMKTGEALAEKLQNAELVLNVDGTGGVLNEESNKPDYFMWGGAEKTYADYTLTVTNPGGHSSEPRPENAIYHMASVLIKLKNYHFKPDLNDITRAYFQQAGALKKGTVGQAMQSFAKNPADQAAIKVLSANYTTVGLIGTTCVATMINGGHALNALPQKVSANINCRIFPGHSKEEIGAELQHVIADPGVKLEIQEAGSVATPASPMRKDFSEAVVKAIHSVYPNLPVIPAMFAGATDNMWFRAHNVPSYTGSPIIMKTSDLFMHGLNERTPLSAIAPSINYFLSLIPDLSH